MNQPGSVRTPFRRVLDVRRTEGGRGLVVKALAATCCSRLSLLERRLDEPVPVLDSMLELRSGQLDPADADEYEALIPRTSAEEVRDRLRAGELCFIVRHRGTLIGVSWAVRGRVDIPYLRGTLALGSHDALVRGTFVARQMRGHNVASIGGTYMLRWLREAGYRRVLGMVLPENAAGFRPLEKLGYRRVGTAYGIGLGRRGVLLIRRKPSAAVLGSSTRPVGRLVSEALTVDKVAEPELKGDPAEEAQDQLRGVARRP